MKLLPKSIGAVIREGDHFVIINNRNGNAVEYSPNAEPGATILGSFGAAKGYILYWTVDETLYRLNTLAEGDEAKYEAICAKDAEIGVGMRPRPEELAEVPLMGLLKGFLDRMDETPEDFVGTVADLLRLIGARDTSQYARKKFLKEMCQEYPDLVEVTGEVRKGAGGGPVIICRWSQRPPPQVKF